MREPGAHRYAARARREPAVAGEDWRSTCSASTAEPEEIAEIVLFLAGTAGGFMTGQMVGTRMRYGQ